MQNSPSNPHLLSPLFKSLKSWLNIKDWHIDQMQVKPKPPFSKEFFTSHNDTLNNLPDEFHKNFPMTLSNFLTMVILI